MRRVRGRSEESEGKRVLKIKDGGSLGEDERNGGCEEKV